MKNTKMAIFCTLKIILLHVSLYVLLFQIKHVLLLLPISIIGYWVLSDKEFENRESFWYFLLVPILAMVLIQRHIIPSLLLSALILMIRDKDTINPFAKLLLVGAVCFSVFKFAKIIFLVSPALLYIVAACIVIPITFFVVFYITRFSPYFFKMRVYLRIATRALISVGLVLLALIPFAYLIMVRGIVDMTLDDMLAFAVLSKIFIYMVEEKPDKIDEGSANFTHYKTNGLTLLFLRKFSYNLKDDACLSSISRYIHNKYPLLHYNTIAIADPRLLYCYNNFSCNFIFLPSVNWKKHVREYIKSSTLVVAVLDSSEGVFWEVFDNADYRYKYIYCLHSQEILTKIIVHPNFKEYEDESLSKYLINLSSTIEARHVQFPLYIHWNGSSFCEDNDVSNILNIKIQNGDIFCLPMRSL